MEHGEVSPATMGGPQPYYVALGLGCDAVVRCKECGRLVLGQEIRAVGACPRCGMRSMTEIRTLSVWEWLKIRLGVLDFPHRQAFLKEFARGRG